MSDEKREPQYSFTVEWSDEDESFIALCPEFPGLSAFGDTHEEAVREAVVALGLMIEVTEEGGEPLPTPLKFVYGRAKSERAAREALKKWFEADTAVRGHYKTPQEERGGEWDRTHTDAVNSRIDATTALRSAAAALFKETVDSPAVFEAENCAPVSGVAVTVAGGDSARDKSPDGAAG